VSGETILIVDDGQDNREFLIEYVLGPNEFKALEARDGAEGLKMAVQHRPDLILLDLNMPRMDGIEVLRRLSERRLDIPVILMTFHGSEDIAVEVYRLGVRDYVKKPYYPEEMLDAIERSLSEIRLRRDKEALTNRLVHANQELQRRVQELNVLYGIGKSVTALQDMDVLLPRLVDAAVQVTQAEEGTLLLVEGDQIICRAYKRHNSGRAQPLKAATRDPLGAHVIKTGQPLLLDQEQGKREGMPTSASYAPLVIKGEVIGVLGVQNVSENAHSFTSHASALLSALTDYAAIAIQNTRNYEALRLSTQHEKERIRGTFERFVSPQVVDRALSEPDSLKLGGNRREISVVFADIRGYTSFSENAPPEAVLEILNHYHSLAAEVILAWEGTLDKFMGDGFMAIFNAPDNQPDHVHRAADAALALVRAAEEVKTTHGHRLSYSIGVHVGEAVVGYIGTDRAMNYTAIGDTVNLAKRLEEYAAPGQILVEEAVVKRLGKLAQARPLGPMKVKGRKNQAFAYELLGLTYETEGR
jgi:class 3 adenylate cyclase/DNA-binding response OmpR family regulator